VSTFDQWVAQCKNRDDAAAGYAELLRRHGVAWRWWPQLNHAIITRWSPATLSYIKSRAWGSGKERA